jgi:hypothetical protein
MDPEIKSPMQAFIFKNRNNIFNHNKPQENEVEIYET